MERPKLRPDLVHEQSQVSIAVAQSATDVAEPSIVTPADREAFQDPGSTLMLRLEGVDTSIIASLDHCLDEVATVGSGINDDGVVRDGAKANAWLVRLSS